MNRSFYTLLLVLLSLLLLTLFYQRTVALRIDLGSPGDQALIDGFYFAEGEGDNTFRWSSGLASLAFPGVGGGDFSFHLRVNGLHPSGPVTVHFTVNDHKPIGSLSIGGEMAEYELPIPQDLLAGDNDLRVYLESPTFTAPPDTRALGVMVDWVELRSTGWHFTLPPWMLLLGIGIATLLLGSGGWRVGLSPSLWWMAAGGWLILLALALWQVPLQLNVYDGWVVGASAIFWLLSGWMRGARLWEWLLLLIVIIAGYRAGVKVVDFYQTGLPPGDFSIYFSAAQNLRHGTPIYDFQAASEMPNGPVYKYPPLFAILLAPFALLPAQRVAAGWYLLNLLLYVGIFALLIACIGWQEAKNDSRSTRYPPPATRPFLLLAALIFLTYQPTWESLIRGQLDVLILAAAILGLWLYLRSHPDRLSPLAPRPLRTPAPLDWLGGGLLALVTMLKLYPGFLWFYLVWKRKWQAAIGFVVVFAGLTIFSGVIVGWDVLWRYASEVLTVQTAAVPYPENQSWDGFVSRFVIPAADTTWYTTIPFAPSVRWLHYALVLLTVLATVLLIWQKRNGSARSFRLGYAATLLVMVMIWPTSWIHYETLLLPSFVFLLHHLLFDLSDGSRQPRWLALAMLLGSYLLLAIGNEYTVLTPWLHQDGWPRLLQSYKLYGMLLLWLLHVRAHSTLITD